MSDVQNPIDTEEVVATQTVAVDFSDVEDTQFEPLPRGRYDVRVIESEYRAGAQHPYLALSFVVEDEESEFNGRRLWDNMSTSPKALWKMKQFLQAAGMTKEELGNLAQNGLPAEDVLDVMVNAGVQQQRGNDGEMRNVIKRYNKIVIPEELEAEVAAEIAAEDASAQE